MARFTAHREVDAPAAAVWELVTDWVAHGRWVPLTTVTVTAGDGGVGTVFVGRSGVGRAAFDDVMEVVRFEPPTSTRAGTAGIAHRGRVVLGTAEVQVVPQPGDRCRVRWTEDVAVFSRRLSRPLLPLLVAGGRLSFGHVLAQVAEEAEAAVRRGAAPPAV